MKTDTAHDLLVLVNPVPSPPTFDHEDVARVVRVARAGGETTRTAAHGLRPGAPRRRRLAVAAAGVAVAAAAASVAVGVLPQGERLGVRPPAAAANPVAVLRAAAVTAAAEPFVVPRPDQFLYVDAGGGYRSWSSVDGTHDGLSEDPAGTTPVPGCRDGVALVEGNYEGVRPQPCTPSPAYRSDIPTDPAALRAWLVVEGNGPETNNVAKEVMYLLEQTLVTPDVRAALFDVVSTYDGLSVSTDGVPAGEVAVNWDFGGGTNSLYFAVSDHRYLGVHAGDGGSSAVTPVVVDAVGRTRSPS